MSSVAGSVNTALLSVSHDANLRQAKIVLDNDMTLNTHKLKEITKTFIEYCLPLSSIPRRCRYRPHGKLGRYYTFFSSSFFNNAVTQSM